MDTVMKMIAFVVLLFVVVATPSRGASLQGLKPTTSADALGHEEECSADNCRLPNCACPSKQPPRDMTQDDTPQMVLLTFDDEVDEDMIAVYQRLFEAPSAAAGDRAADRKWTTRTTLRTNPNGCPVSVTFYVSHNGTRYDVVSEFYRRGHELASHSVSHRMPQGYWRNASYSDWDREVSGQRENLARLAVGVSLEAIGGVRAPYLETGGDAQFKMLIDRGFEHDASFMTGPNADGGVWPFTLDYPASTEFCSNVNCPRKRYAGLWELPLNRWMGADGQACSMADGCVPVANDRHDAFAYFLQNFNRFYRGNRAPFGVHLHADWLTKNPAYLDGFELFLDVLADKKDVFVVSARQVIEWMRSPRTLNELEHFEPWRTSCRLLEVPPQANAVVLGDVLTTSLGADTVNQSPYPTNRHLDVQLLSVAADVKEIRSDSRANTISDDSTRYFVGGVQDVAARVTQANDIKRTSIEVDNVIAPISADETGSRSTGQRTEIVVDASFLEPIASSVDTIQITNTAVEAPPTQVVSALPPSIAPPTDVSTNHQEHTQPHFGAILQSDQPSASFGIATPVKECTFLFATSTFLVYLLTYLLIDSQYRCTS